MRNRLRFPWILLAHLVFWAGYFLIVYFIFTYLLDWKGALTRTLIMGSFHALLMYTHLYVVWPRFMSRGKYFQYAIALAATWVSFIFLRAGADQLLFWINPWFRVVLESPRYWGGSFLFGGVILLISAPFRMVEVIGKQVRAEEQLRNLRLEAEIRHLKGQFQPHFLFNTLNNLYTLALTGSPKTADGILRLSGLMRYAMESGETEEILLKKEWEMVQEFVEIGQLRYESADAIALHISGKIDTQLVPPLILLPFIENAFKHGNLDEAPDASLEISLEIFPGRINYTVRNTYNPHPNRRIAHSGRGLMQLEQRLHLLYGKEYQLRFGNNNGLYESFLSIPLQLAS